MSQIDPFFIVGCGRSGTTMLRTILDRHPDLAIPPESLFIVDYLRPSNRLKGRKLLFAILDEVELREWGISFSADSFNDITLNSKEIINRLHELYSAERGKSLWGQKTPRFVRHYELLKLHYPDSKFIHVIRDPRGVVNSLIKSNVHQSNALFGALRWKHDVDYGLALKKKHPDDVLEVLYEDFVKNPESITIEICNFLNIRYDESMLSYEDVSLPEYASRYYESVHKLLTEPPDSSRINSWQSSLSKNEIAVVNHYCGPLMKLYGYKYELTGKPNGLLILVLLGERVIGFIRQVIHSLVNRPGYIPCVVRRKLRTSLALLSPKQD